MTWRLPTEWKIGVVLGLLVMSYLLNVADLSLIKKNKDYVIVQWDYLFVLDIDKTDDFSEGGLRLRQEDSECLQH